MRMQDEKTKTILCGRALISCCLGSNVLLIDKKLWLKFLYLIFDKQHNQIDNYFKNNIDSLVRMCTENRRLQQVIT